MADLAAVGAVIGTAIGLIAGQTGDSLTRTIGATTILFAAFAVLIVLIEGVR